jgi:hypothetical protein
LINQLTINNAKENVAQEKKKNQKIKPQDQETGNYTSN